MSGMIARHKWQIETIKVLEEVFSERGRQVDQYGQNDDLEDGTGKHSTWLGLELDPGANLTADEIEESFRSDYDSQETLTWMHLVREEIAESFAESDPTRLEEELVQVAALCVSWIESIRKRAS